MALKVNLAQINSAARGNSDLRETLTGIHLALQSLYAQTGTAPLDEDRRDRDCLYLTTGAFAVRGERGEWELHRLHHDTAERFRSHRAAQCDQRAYLPGDIEFTGGQLCLRRDDLPGQHEYELCLP